MARQAEIERKKSILGHLDAGDPGEHTENGAAAKVTAKTGDPGEEIARENLIRRIKDLRFFSLDATDTMLKTADWLPYVCWQAEVPEILARQNQLLSCEEENPIDSLLLSAFEFVDVNEATAVVRIVEESARAHGTKVDAYFKQIAAITPADLAPDPVKTMDGTLKDAALGDPGPEH
jgi:hypothetical protein